MRINSWLSLQLNALISAIKYIFWGFRICYIIILFFRTFISFFLSNGLRVWLILELNFMCFVRILRQEFRFNHANGNLYYFLIQSLGRAFILLSLLVILVWKVSIFSLIFFFAILLKLGGAPFQFWYLKLITKISWFNIWLLSIWQKFIPLILIKFRTNISLQIVFGFLRVIFGRLRNLSQKKIKKILGLSSLFSLGWILSSLFLRKVWVWFLAGYGVALLNLLNYFKTSNLLNIETSENSKKNFVRLLGLFISLLIVRGIPPFILFYLKVLILLFLLKFSLIIILLFLFFSVFIIYIYLIIGFSLLVFLKIREFSVIDFFKSKYKISNLILYNLVFRFLIIAFI